MARTAPISKTPNPAVHFFEWAGGSDGGFVTYYDKNAVDPRDQKKGVNVKCPANFSFLVLDILSTIKGWHDASDSGIFSNEVRDTVSEPLVVKSFEGGPIATGFYQAIRDRIVSAGGRFTSVIYIAFKETGVLKIGALQFHGAALNAWVDFRKEAGAKLWDSAIVISGHKEGKKGSIIFRTPVFTLKLVSKEMDDAAGELQTALKAYHTEYFARTKTEQAAHAPAAAATPTGEHQQHSPPESNQDSPPDQEPEPATAPLDDVPF